MHQPTGDNDLCIDLHTHTVSSDGVRDDKKLLKEAIENNVDVIAITDHDTIAGCNLVRKSQLEEKRFNGDIINGVEITSRLQGDPIETLVYDFDLEKANQLIRDNKFPFLNREFKIKKFIELLSKRLDIINKLNILDKHLTLNDFITIEIPNESGGVDCKTLAESGLDIESTIKSSLKDGNVFQKIKIDGKVYNLNFDCFNSKLLKFINSTQKGQDYLKQFKAADKNEIMKFAEFNRSMIQGKDSPLYVDDSQYYPTVEQVCEFAKQSGGVAIFAHPFGYGTVKTSPEILMKRAVQAGVDGIECMHGFNEPNEIEKIYKFCYENNLLITAGSDIHGYYATQGTQTQVGLFPGQGVMSKVDNNVLDRGRISTYNLHFVGSGAWRGEKEFNIESQPEK